ncbi:hypothetical protein [Nocardioides sp. 616]|uniref:hypothetical protein n=1 Tax=Nocardioides sp. 616 TaxID=2268090 RepID=UPI0013B361C5|nr:hypothetical protein [Nocardioides sp. 616]
MHLTKSLSTSSRARTRLLAGLCAGGLTAVVLGVPTGASAAASTCRGVAATVEGTPGVPLTGTPTADVVVTNGATAVSTLGGDDLVCVTGGTAYVDTATGNDTVDTISAGGAAVQVYLGPGADRFEGGEGADTVGTHGADLVPDEHADVILTGGGNDVVSSGAAGELNPDTVDLGDGNDRLEVRGATGSQAGTLSGGSGSDELVLDLSGTATWVINNNLGVARRLGQRRHRWTAFEQFDLTPTQGAFRFVGSPSNERLDYSEPGGSPVGPVTVLMGEGNDTVVAPPQAAGGARYDGGGGRNTFVVSSPAEHLTLDLLKGRLDHGPTGADGSAAAIVSLFSDATVLADRAVVRGDANRNTLKVGGCKAQAFGRARGDVLRRVEVPGLTCTERSKFLGGSGDDRLIGGPGKDKLFGGSGRDKADGRKGKDTCRTERRKRCEKR